MADGAPDTDELPVGLGINPGSSCGQQWPQTAWPRAGQRQGIHSMHHHHASCSQHQPQSIIGMDHRAASTGHRQHGHGQGNGRASSCIVQPALATDRASWTAWTIVQPALMPDRASTAWITWQPALGTGRACELTCCTAGCSVQLCTIWSKFCP
jgi:hypothetical protein